MTQLHCYQYYFYYCHYNNSPNKKNNSNPLFHEHLLCTRYHDNNFTTLYHIVTFCHNYHTYTSFSSQTSGYWCWKSSIQNPLCVGHTKANNVKHCLVSTVKGYKHFTYEHWMHFPLLPCTERTGPTMQSLKFYRKTLICYFQHYQLKILSYTDNEKALYTSKIVLHISFLFHTPFIDINIPIIFPLVMYIWFAMEIKPYLCW